ncbi:hypothetical protein Hypma_004766 [Hypsizygus marmoreus]|uniref:Uncharacterized protein n=1 Tax=Hypsizygus marmoreus TaxID=39966 RepID=A0A369IZR7_HYPMA|nr:hypothetical protein Hypma_004766 [Hypsizygus marmoreus]
MFIHLLVLLLPGKILNHLIYKAPVAFCMIEAVKVLFFCCGNVFVRRWETYDRPAWGERRGAYHTYEDDGDDYRSGYVDSMPTPKFEPEPPVDFKTPLRQEFLSVLLFPVDERAPRIIQMPYDVRLDGTDLMDDTTVYWEYKKRSGISQYIPGDLEFTFVTRRWGRRGKNAKGKKERHAVELGRILEVMCPWYDDDAPPESRPPLNKCMEALTGGSGAVSPKWYGNVLVTRIMNGRSDEPGTFWHLGYKHLADEFEAVDMKEDIGPLTSFFKTFEGVKEGVKVIHEREKDVRPGLWFPVFGPGVRHWKHELCGAQETQSYALGPTSNSPPRPGATHLFSSDEW